MPNEAECNEFQMCRDSGYMNTNIGYNKRNAAGFASSGGLYDPAFEHDSCGMGFVARLDGESRHSVVENAVQILGNLEHRGALGGDKATGDGAGLLLQIPDAFFRRECLDLGFKLPAVGEYAVAMIFLPSEPVLAQRFADTIERITTEEGCECLGWRDVSIDSSHIGELSKSTMPLIRQLIIAHGAIEVEAFERKLYVIRRLVEKDVLGWNDVDASQCYIPSFSSKTVVYKGLLVGKQLNQFFPELEDKDFASPYALIHQRYSTNTLPTWSLAQPFRYLAHNGEINTLRGNITRMHGREALFKSELFGDDIEKIKPILVESGSDSAILDNALELLVLAGRSLPHAMMMLVPEAYGKKFLMSEDKRAFYEYHASIMEPWDGPAALVFTNGRYIGATLDRNGLRPARFTVTRDGFIIMASETGVLEVPGEQISSRGRLRPGKMFLVDLDQNRVIPDNEIKAKISRQKPYRRWLNKNRIELRGLFSPSEIPAEPIEERRRKQHAFGYSEEELNMIINPMGSNGQEPIGSMGNDAPLAVLSNRPQLLFNYFKQLFAQVTNPAIDPHREELVMDLSIFTGRRGNLLDEIPEHCRQLELKHPILTPEDMSRLRHATHPDLVVRDMDILFPAGGDGNALEESLGSLFREAEQGIADGVTCIILTDKNMDKNRVPIPSLLAVSGLHHHLIRRGLRTRVAIMVETGEAREIIHFALLLGFGASAICPYVAYSTIREMSLTNLLEKQLTPEEAFDNYINAVKKGLLKTFSRMGISTANSFFGSQIFEAVGLSHTFVDKYFTHTSSRINGIGLDEIAHEAKERHKRGFPKRGKPKKLLEVGGAIHSRINGESHLWEPEKIYKFQQAVRNNDYETFKEYTKLVDDQASSPITLRSLLRFRRGNPIPIDEVEPVESIVTRFASAAMSYGSISKETHEIIAIAMNRLGGRSNSGEGGEDPARYILLPGGDSKRSRIKQIASGRFGVTSEYLIHADELQIKVAQGAKPGEGGQLPGHKVSEDIARVRHTVPGVTLISPPPHHDIYSIEDLKQLINDLKAGNPNARVSVKLVAEVGVGTIAAGVAKANADIVIIAGHDGGTGASPITSIKHTGLPWELGLAETQQVLINNQLRDRIRVQVDGQLRTGRDLAIAVLLGAEEYGFGTSVLVALGCVMMRKCHLNTCPVGVATQDESLRARFTGKAEFVERYLRFIAQELREYMAMLGFKTINDMVGRAHFLEPDPNVSHWKARRLDLNALLYPLADAQDIVRYCIRGQESNNTSSLDSKLIRKAKPALDSKKPVAIEMPIRNIHLTVGATLSAEITKKYGPGGLPEDTIQILFSGTAGQSFGAFLAPGVTMKVAGDANDYLGKGLSGGKIIVVPPEFSRFVPHENIIIGNVILYGATSGEIYIHGLAGERFAVRNSGAKAVVEGIGDHGCEYMTGGIVVVLGPTGNNFAAGMSGGIAYVYDESELFGTRCNLDMVDLESVWMTEDKKQLKTMIEMYYNYTKSAKAQAILDNWEAHLPLFVKVMPIEYRKALERMRQEVDLDSETVSATEEIYHV